MTLGAEPKKLAVLGALLVIMPVAYYWANGDSPTPGASQSKSSGAKFADRMKASEVGVATPPDLGRQSAARIAAARGRDRTSIADYKPSLKPRRPEDRPDPLTVDPTLKLTLISRLKNVNVAGGRRSLFDFGAAAPVVKQPDPKQILPGKAKPIGPELPPKPVVPVVNTPPPPPPPAPLPFKFYGFIGGKPAGAKKAFFLEGDDVYIAGEGELVKRRYKVVRIGINTVVMEDTQEKNQQTLQMVEDIQAI